MPDREKVMKGLECCITDGRALCEKCYQEGPGFGIACRQGLMRDALALLKGQEAVEPIRNDIGIGYWYQCGACGAALGVDWKYCHNCGKAVKRDG